MCFDSSRTAFQQRFFPGAWRKAGPAELLMQRMLFQKSTPSPAERSDPIRLLSGGRRGKEGGEGGIRMLPSQHSGLPAKNVSLNSSPASAVPDPESLESLCPEAFNT